MKKTYTSFLTSCLIALAVNTALAQAPTITSAYLPVVGKSYNDMADSTSADLAGFTVTAGSSSAQTWNYASKFVSTYASPISFVSPSSGLGSSSFSGSNLAATANGTWEYFTANSNGLALNGYYANYGSTIGYVSVVFTPASGEVIIPTPFTYGNTHTSTYASTYSFTASGYTIIQRQHSIRTVSADAYGTLTTPAGTYSNTLRTKAFQRDIDTEFVYMSSTLVSTNPSRDSSVSYEWLQNSQNFLLMEIDMNGAGTSVTGANYLTSVTSGIVNNTTPFSELNLFPNPASDKASLSYENQSATHVKVEMFDVAGKLITTLVDENQSSGKQTIAIDTKALQVNSGLYLIRISSPNGLQTLKLSIK